MTQKQGLILGAGAIAAVIFLRRTSIGASALKAAVKPTARAPLPSASNGGYLASALRPTTTNLATRSGTATKPQAPSLAGFGSLISTIANALKPPAGKQADQKSQGGGTAGSPGGSSSGATSRPGAVRPDSSSWTDAWPGIRPLNILPSGVEENLGSWSDWFNPTRSDFGSDAPLGIIGVEEMYAPDAGWLDRVPGGLETMPAIIGPGIEDNGAGTYDPWFGTTPLEEFPSDAPVFNDWPNGGEWPGGGVGIDPGYDMLSDYDPSNYGSTPLEEWPGGGGGAEEADFADWWQ